MVDKKKKQVKHVVGALVFYLKPLPQGSFLMALSEHDKPVAPITEVEYAGGTKVMEPNPHDEGYRRDLEMWNAQYNSRMFRLCVTRGIDRVEDRQGTPVEPSSDDLSDVRFVYGSNIPHRTAMHYWYADKIGDTASGFMNLVMGQTEVTEEGLEESEARFQPDGAGAGVERED
jgi:hypothetical protein